MEADESENVRPYTPHSILLCDDAPDIRETVGGFLRRKGFAVTDLDNAHAALEHLKSSRVDCVLLDLHMPGQSGFEVLRYLQEHRKALPVILLSGMPLDSIQRKMHNLPSHELPPLLLKPIDFDQLLQLLDLLLNGEMPKMPENPDTSA